MVAPNPKKQKAGWKTIDTIFADPANCWVVHYSCESFYDRPNGASPRITSIAIRKLDSGQTVSFSIHQIAEQKKVPFKMIDAKYDDLERLMLKAYYAHLGSHKGMKYLHWNMRDINYGFAAIDHRFTVLGRRPVVLEDDKKIDIARLLIDIFGVGYIGHPRLAKLMEKNSIEPLDFLSGAQEAEAFETRNFVGLHQSTLRKVDIIANIAERTYHRQLKTNTRWWQMHGGRFRSFVDWCADNKIITVLVSLATFVGLGLAIYSLK
jgi:hypothetical protein